MNILPLTAFGTLDVPALERRARELNSDHRRAMAAARAAKSAPTPAPVAAPLEAPKRLTKQQFAIAERPARRAARRRARIDRQKAKACRTVPGIELLALDPCSYCEDPHPTTHDHIVPVSKGGTHTLDNLTRACLRCNFEKATFSLLVFLARRASRMAAA